MPKKTSTARKLATGTARADRLGSDAKVQPLSILPRPPRGTAPDVRKFWQVLGRRCVERQTLSTGDLQALLLAAEALAAAARCQAVVDRDGPTAPGAGGRIDVHPLLKEYRAWSAEGRRWLGSLGLTPASRPGVERVPPSAGGSDFEDFLQGPRR